MKSAVLLIVLSPSAALAGGHCGVFQQYKAAAVNHYQAVYHAPYVLYAAVGQETQVEAQVARAQKPLVEEIKGLRGELAALRGEQKQAFSQLFKFRGQGTITFEGGNDPTPTPKPDPKPNPNPQPEPSAGRGPRLTEGMQALLANTCAACHDGAKQKAFTLDGDSTLDEDRSADIFARLWSDKQGFRMPPNGSNEQMRQEANDWFVKSAAQALVEEREKQASNKKGR